MRKALVKKLIIGFVIGAIVGNSVAMISSLFYGHFAIIADSLKNSLGLAGGILIQSFFSGLIGLAGIGGMLFYDVEKWSLVSATIAHFASIIISFTIAFFLLGWGDRSLVVYVIIVASEVISFIIIWLIMFNHWKKRIKELNENLAKYKEEKLNEEGKQ